MRKLKADCAILLETEVDGVAFCKGRQISFSFEDMDRVKFQKLAESRINVNLAIIKQQILEYVLEQFDKKDA